jgi:hypothetical protein
MKIAKAHGYQKILAIHLYKDFKRKLWRGFWAQPLPLLQNHYPIKPLHTFITKAWSVLFATGIDGDGDKPLWR